MGTILIIFIVIIIIRLSFFSESSKAFKECVYEYQYEDLLRYSEKQFAEIGFETEEAEDAIVGYYLKFNDNNNDECIAKSQILVLDNYDGLKHRYCINIEYIKRIEPDKMSYYQGFCNYANECRTKNTKSFIHRVERQKDMAILYICNTKWANLETEIEQIDISYSYKLIWKRIKFIENEINRLHTLYQENL